MYKPGNTGDIYTCLVLLVLLSIQSALAQCDTPLGFENGNITDEQLSASSTYGIFTADQARLNVGRGWSGRSSYFSKVNHYLEVDLLTQHNVTRYSIQGNTNGYPITVAMFFSQDRLVWKRYTRSDGTDTLEGNDDDNTVRSFDLVPPVQARYFVFQPVFRSGKPSLRLELYGCEADLPVSVDHTVIQRHIDDTQEWLPNQSPYVFNSMITIQHSGHVKVHPGVKVIFNSSDAGLIVLGTLEANGQSGFPIVLSSASPGISNPNQWVGIEVAGQGNLTLNHCDIHGAVTGVKGPLSSITVRHCHIHHNNIGVDLSSGDTDPGRTQFVGAQVTDNSQQGIYGSVWEDGRNFIALKACEFTRNSAQALKFDRTAVTFIENSVFSNNEYGIYQDYVYDGLSLTMKNCNVTDNIRDGLYLNSNFINITITDSQINDNRNDGIRLNIRTPSRGSHIIITNTKFTNNRQQAMTLGGESSGKKTNIFVRDSTFVSSSSSKYLVDIGYKIGYTNEPITDIIVQNNSFSTRQAVQFLGEKQGTYKIVNNRFTGMTGDRGIQVAGNSVVISENYFSNCSSTSVLYIKVPHTTITRNSFLNQESQYDVLLDVAYTEGGRVNASHNYWGSSDKFYVRSRICDFFCDMTKAIAEVHPFYTTESLTELSTELDSDLFSFQRVDTIGGILTESVTLDPHQYLFVNRSLFIPEGYTLTILENVTLVFPYKQGIYVQGVLLTEGAEEGKVLLTNHRSDHMRWGGVIFNSTGSTIKHMMLEKCQTGLNITTNNTGTIVVTDSIITQCDTAISGQLWTDVFLSLHKVKVIALSQAIRIDAMNEVSVSVDFVQCDIYGHKGINLYSDRKGHFNVSVYSTKVSSRRNLFAIESCSSSTTVRAYNSFFISKSFTYALNVNGGQLNVHARNISIHGSSMSLVACGPRGLEPGTIDIRDSYFNVTRYSLIIGTGFPESDTPHKVILLNNTVQTSVTFPSVSLEVGPYYYPWTVAAEGNTFVGSGIEMKGNLCNNTIEENTFQQTKTVLNSDLQCSETSLTKFSRNVVHGGRMIFSSEGVNDRFHVQNNFFNLSEIILKNPSTTLQHNIFLNNSAYDVKFEGQGHADDAINCTYNYWGTTNKNLINRRLYDSSYDESLPTINFIPFYGFPNLTDLQYPVETFLSSDGTIGGNVGGNVTLTASGSPYTVTASIVVGKLDILIVEAGVTLLFTEGMGISVEGTIKIFGNRSQPVLAHPLVPGQKWKGVELHDQTNGSEFHYFHLNHTEQGLELNQNILTVEGVSSKFSNTHGITINVVSVDLPMKMDGFAASHNRKSGVFITADKGRAYGYFQMEASNCEIDSNGQNGISIDSDLNISIVNCQFVRNKKTAVHLEIGSSLIDISQSLFSENEGGIFDTYGSYNKGLKFSLRHSYVLNHDMLWNSENSIFFFNPRYTKQNTFTFLGNEFSGNKGNIFNFVPQDNDNEYIIHITDNVFKDNNASISSLRAQFHNKIHFYFVNNSLENNTVPDFRQPLLKLSYLGKRVEISENIFFKNAAPQIVSLLGEKNPDSDTIMINNNFNNNSCYITVETSLFALNLKNNTFSNPVARCELEAPLFDRWYGIDARWNYWGGQDTDHVLSKICGFDTDMTRGFVSYLPCYFSEDFSTASTDRQTDFWISNLNGGVIDRYLRLEKSTSPYHIRRSIFIRRNGILDIESGVEMKFQQNTGIYVDGLLLAGGGSPERVSFTRDSNKSWFGVVLPFKTVGVSETVRLVNGTRANEGRVEVFVEGSWATVCNMDQADALLVCQALGYGSAETSTVYLSSSERRGPVLYNLGCDKNVTSLSQCRQDSRYMFCSRRQHSRLYVTCQGFVALTGINMFSNLEGVSILDSKEGLIIQTSTIRLSNCHINNTEKAGLTVDIDHIDLDLNGTVVEHGQTDGILVKVPKDLRIVNGTIQHNQGNGMFISNVVYKAAIEKMNFVNNTKDGIYKEISFYTYMNSISVRNNVFKDHIIDGVGLNLRFHQQSDINIYVENNTFINNLAGSIEMTSVNTRNYYGHGHAFILGNRFVSSGPVVLSTPYSMYINDNKATNCTSDETCFLTLNTINYANNLKLNVRISTNIFENTYAKCVVNLTYGDYMFNGTFNFNQIFNSSTKEAAVILDSSRVKFSHNLFNNPSTDYDLKIQKIGSEVINAENNWWGTTDPITAGDRVFHKKQDQRLLTVDYLPILTDQTFDCSGVDNCSRKGECVRPNGCRCVSGWTGADCSDFDCSGIGNCNGNGVCVGQNQCECSSGWEGQSCVIAICNDAGNCGVDSSSSSLSSTSSISTVSIDIASPAKETLSPLYSSSPVYTSTTISNPGSTENPVSNFTATASTSQQSDSTESTSGSGTVLPIMSILSGLTAMAVRIMIP